MAFDFSYDESQLALAQSARRLLRELPRRRRIGVQPARFDSTLWARMADLGWPGIRVPAAYGGADAGLEDCYPVLEELGRHMVDSPMVDTIFLTELLLAHGDDAQRASLLPGVAAGEVTAAVAATEPDGALASATRPGLLLSASADGLRLNGSKLLVESAASVSHLVCVAATAPRGQLRTALVPTNP